MKQKFPAMFQEYIVIISKMYYILQWQDIIRKQLKIYFLLNVSMSHSA